MTAVPGYVPSEPPEPNLPELYRLRAVERRNRERAAAKKRERLHDNYWANNPAATFDVPRQPRRINPWHRLP